jgi:DNA-binding NarL/FixJ family response regulator
MKVVEIQGTKYYISSRDDMISLAHQLARKGYSESEIARLLQVSERTVKKYLSDCW